MMIHAARLVTHIVLLVHCGGVRGGGGVIVQAGTRTGMYTTAGRWMSDGIERWMRWTHSLCHELTSVIQLFFGNGGDSNYSSTRNIEEFQTRLWHCKSAVHYYYYGDT